MTPCNQPIRVLVVDDDAIVCSSLRTILGAQDSIEVVGTGVNGLEAIEQYAALKPDILLMDIQMPQCDGLQAARTILAKEPAARIVFLTTFADDEYLVRALKLGACGYLVKQDVAAIAPALCSVMDGHRVLEGRVVDLSQLTDPLGATPLTERERDVVRLVADGLDNSEIAGSLYLSEGTVRNHISAILAKLGLKNRTQLAVWYYRHRLG